MIHVKDTSTRIRELVWLNVSSLTMMARRFSKVVPLLLLIRKVRAKHFPYIFIYEWFQILLQNRPTLDNYSKMSFHTKYSNC